MGLKWTRKIYIFIWKNYDWFDIKLLIDWNKLYEIKQCIQDETYQNAMKDVFKKLKIFITHFVNFGSGFGPIEMEPNKMEPQYRNNLGNCKPDTQDDLYSDAGVSENYKFHYNPSTVTKPPEELQRLISPFIEKFKISINVLYASDPRPTFFFSLDFMERGRTVLLQDVARLMNIGRTHILFYREFFKTGLFLNYR